MTDVFEPAETRSEVVQGRGSTDDVERVARARWWWQGLRPLLLRLHFYVGIFVGPFVLIAAVTGCLYTLAPQLEDVVHHQELHVPVGTTTVPMAEQVRAAERVIPEGTLVEVRPAARPGGTTRVSFSTTSVDADHARTVFVDPYTGRVRGTLTTFGEWLPLRAWFDSLHRTLLLGSVGRVYSELAASWLWVLAVSGLGIWLVRGRRRRRLRRTLLPRLEGRGRGRLLTWHGTIGLWLAIGMFFLSATGLTWSQFAGKNVSELRSHLSWSTPTADASLTKASSTRIAKSAQPFAVARVWSAALADGITGTTSIVPGANGVAWTVSEDRRTWPERHDTVTVDPADGQVLDRVDFADWPFPAKLAQWGIDAHMGLLFGIANQVALAILAVGLIAMILAGYRMWWHRRPTRADAASRLPAALGAGQAPARIAVLVVALLGIAVALFAPVLGASLLLFLVADAVQATVVGRGP